jgi:hypothetical protein
MMLVIGFTSCKKETENTDVTGAKNEVLSAFVDKALSEDIDAATLNRSTSQGQPCNWQLLLPDCATISESGDDYPKEIIIDFGDGCVDNFGRVKSGQIVINLSNDMQTEGSVRTVSFIEFYVDDVNVLGSRTTTNMGVDSEGHPQFEKLHDIDLVKNGNSLSRDFQGFVTWLEGYDTEICGDNVFMLEGSGQCERPNGAVISRSIVEPLIIDRECGYIIQGVVQILAPPGPRSIDFGDGECDDIAYVTANGNTWEISLNP